MKSLSIKQHRRLLELDFTFLLALKVLEKSHLAAADTERDRKDVAYFNKHRINRL